MVKYACGIYFTSTPDLTFLAPVNIPQSINSSATSSKYYRTLSSMQANTRFVAAFPCSLQERDGKSTSKRCQNDLLSFNLLVQKSPFIS